MLPKPTYIDLFAGCGGLSLGLHNAGWQGLFAVEKSPDAFETLEYNLIYKRNHFNWPIWLGKPTHLEIDKVIKKHKNELISLQGQVDLIAGGPPCQGFSTAGKRNEEDKRNKLIHSYIKFIEYVKPKMLFFENVKGFTMEFDKTKGKGKRYSDYVIRRLNSLGYSIHAELINFSEFGIPQKRCRFILVGVRNDICETNSVYAKHFFSLIKENREQFLISKNLEITVPLEEAISDLLRTNGKQVSPDNKNFQAGVFSPPQSKYQLFLREGIDAWNIADSHRFANHTPEIEKRFELILKYSEKGKSISDEIKRRFGIKKRTIVPLNPSDQAPTITTLPDDYIHYKEARILTVREYARIQSFPDTYEFKGKYTTGGKARTREVPRYTQIGNAIPPLFGEQSGLILSKLVSNG